jgi:creatinine amidohydrolase
MLRAAAREAAKTTSLVVVLINWWVDLANEARRHRNAAEDEMSEVTAAHLVREVPRDVDEWVEARYAVFGREVNQLLYQKAVQGYQRPQERRGRPSSRRRLRSSSS